MTSTLLFGLVIAYLIGAIPFGWVVVKLISGKDVTNVESGRTGGTNAMRAAGIIAGLLTVLLDAGKGAAVVWLARAIDPGSIWLVVLAPVMAILGHNYSIFLVQVTPEKRIRFRGGAGGATCVGGAFGLWPPSLLIIVPVVAIIWYGVGYASVTTMSAALLALVIFAYRAYLGLNPWAYVIYALLAEVLLVWALIPNIKRLANGTERLIGWRAKLKQKPRS